jgi:TorA maturation chaperone TorD
LVTGSATAKLPARHLVTGLATAKLPAKHLVTGLATAKLLAKHSVTGLATAKLLAKHSVTGLATAMRSCALAEAEGLLASVALLASCLVVLAASIAVHRSAVAAPL